MMYMYMCSYMISVHSRQAVYYDAVPLKISHHWVDSLYARSYYSLIVYKLTRCSTIASQLLVMVDQELTVAKVILFGTVYVLKLLSINTVTNYEI